MQKFQKEIIINQSFINQIDFTLHLCMSNIYFILFTIYLLIYKDHISFQLQIFLRSLIY